MPTVNFIRTAAKAWAYGHTIVIETTQRGPKAWSWRLFEDATGRCVANGFTAQEAGSRSAAKKALFAIPAVARAVAREAAVHWNGEPSGHTRAQYSGAPRACGAADGMTTNDPTLPLTCTACLDVKRRREAEPAGAES